MQIHDWEKVNTVLLDLDGTLLDLHFDNYFWMTHLPERYAEQHAMPLNEATDKLRALVQQYAGTLQWYCLDHWSELVGMDIPALKIDIQHKIRTRPHAEAFLKFLNAQQKKVVLATNAHRKGLSLKLETTKIEHHFDRIVSSHDYAQPKESAEFWHTLLERENIDPQTSIFVDDNVQVLRAAKAFDFYALICITQPDSQKPSSPSEEFIDIVDFHEIMPAATSWQAH